MSVPNTSQWFAVQVRPQHEDKVAAQLTYKGQAVLLPQRSHQKVWSDRKVAARTPLFPGYVFCQMGHRSYATILNTLGVVRIVSFGGKPFPVSEEEMFSLQKIIEVGRNLSAIPYSPEGHKVQVTHGPLAGVTGILDRTEEKNQLIVSFDVVMRSVAIDVYLSEVETTR